MSHRAQCFHTLHINLWPSKHRSLVRDQKIQSEKQEPYLWSHAREQRKDPSPGRNSCLESEKFVITRVFKKDQQVGRIDLISRRPTLKVCYPQSQNNWKPTNPQYLNMHPNTHSTLATNLPPPGRNISLVVITLWQSCFPKAMSPLREFLSTSLLLGVPCSVSGYLLARLLF